MDEAFRFIRAVESKCTLTFAFDDPYGDSIAARLQRKSAEPTPFGKDFSPVWKILDKSVKESTKIQVLLGARFQTDSSNGVMRVITDTKVYKV